MLVDGGLVVRAGGRYSCAVRPLIKICGRRAHFDVTVIEPAPVPPVRAVGGVVARKAGVARATGARLVFVHDDSVVDPDFVPLCWTWPSPGCAPRARSCPTPSSSAGRRCSALPSTRLRSPTNRWRPNGG